MALRGPNYWAGASRSCHDAVIPGANMIIPWGVPAAMAALSYNSHLLAPQIFRAGGRSDSQ
jgi:hypothetical protein